MKQRKLLLYTVSICLAARLPPTCTLPSYCLPACLLVCPPACLPACRLACLLVCHLSVRLSVCLHVMRNCVTQNTPHNCATQNRCALYKCIHRVKFPTQLTCKTSCKPSIPRESVQMVSDCHSEKQLRIHNVAKKMNSFSFSQVSCSVYFNGTV
jgi:hypothetical protein